MKNFFSNIFLLIVELGWHRARWWGAVVVIVLIVIGISFCSSDDDYKGEYSEAKKLLQQQVTKKEELEKELERKKEELEKMNEKNEVAVEAETTPTPDQNNNPFARVAKPAEEEIPKLPSGRTFDEGMKDIKFLFWDEPIPEKGEKK